MSKIRFIEQPLNIQKAYMAAKLIDIYFSEEGGGGTLHIVLSDGNIRRSDVEFCLPYAIERKDFWGETIARLLLELNDEELEQVLDRSYEIEQLVEYGIVIK